MGDNRDTDRADRGDRAGRAGRNRDSGGSKRDGRADRGTGIGPGGSGLQRTSYAALIGVAGFSAAATLILMRRFYGAVASISMLVPSSLWVLALACGFLVVVVKKRRDDGRVGLDRSQLNPMMATNFMLFGKASAWVGAIATGAYLGPLMYVVPKLGVLAAAGDDLPALASGVLGGLALAIAGILLEKACEVSPPSSGEAVS